VPPGLGTLRGKKAVREFYESFLSQVEAEAGPDALIAGRDCVMTIGPMRVGYPGTMLEQLGLSVEDPGSLYLFDAPISVLWPFTADSKLLGELVYFAADGFAGIEKRRIDPARIANIAKDEVATIRA
jgi:hypothetical protein